MSQYHYSSLSSEPDRIRLLRLMPYENESTKRSKIQCELFECTLQDPSEGTHLYEALSYTWGGSEKPCSISIDKQNFDVTENLHAALLRLRDRFVERILWVDAICINQENAIEQGQQVQFMAKIYCKAARVLVWLGDTAHDGDVALEMIRTAADNESTKSLNDKAIQQAIVALLGRAWFQRIWVLQEVAAARHILIVCGSTVIDGYTFSLGVTRFYEVHPGLESSIRPITGLIRGAIFRPKHTMSPPGSVSLNIRPLSELIDMFHTHMATKPVDKVYALLGMSSDDPSSAGLLPNYNLLWKELFKDLVKFILGKDASVETFDDCQRAVIKSKGYILGQVSSVKSDNRGHVKITWDLNGKTEWTLQASAEPIQERDIICLLYGASKPTIIRLYRDYFAIVVIAATPLNESGSFIRPELSQSAIHFPRGFLLVWNWEQPLGESQDQKEFALEYPQAESGDYLERATRFWDAIMILDDLKEYEKADIRLQEARDGYVTAFGLEHLLMLGPNYGRTPLSFVAGGGHENMVKRLLAEEVDANSKDYNSGRTPLSWAAESGHEVVVKLLLESGKADADSRDDLGQTPLSWAAERGQATVVKLLLESGKVDADSRDNLGQTPLSWAAGNRHEEVVKLLLESGKVDANSRDKLGWTPLSWAAESGHEAVVELLLKSGKAEADSRKHRSDSRKHRSDWTPLLEAARSGNVAEVKLLLKSGKVDADSRDESGQTPLSWAAERGHVAVVKVLLESGKVDADSREDSYWNRTPLSLAAGNGHEAVVKLLLASGKVDAYSNKYSRRMPRSWAVLGGHEAVVKLLNHTVRE